MKSTTCLFSTALLDETWLLIAKAGPMNCGPMASLKGLIILSVLLLLLIKIKSLDYHSRCITWISQLLVVTNKPRVERFTTTTYQIKVRNLSLTQIFSYSYKSVTRFFSQMYVAYCAITAFLEITDSGVAIPQTTNVFSISKL